MAYRRRSFRRRGGYGRRRVFGRVRRSMYRAYRPMRRRRVFRRRFYIAGQRY